MATDILTGPTILGSTTRTKIFKNFIDGEWVESSTGETFENRNPADIREVAGIFQQSGKDDGDAAIAAAARGFATSPLVPAPRRAGGVCNAGERLGRDKEAYSHDITP